MKNYKCLIIFVVLIICVAALSFFSFPTSFGIQNDKGYLINTENFSGYSQNYQIASRWSPNPLPWTDGRKMTSEEETLNENKDDKSNWVTNPILLEARDQGSFNVSPEMFDKFRKRRKKKKRFNGDEYPTKIKSVPPKIQTSPSLIGDKYIAITDVNGFNNGDYIKINPNCTNQEIAKVDIVNGNLLYLTEPLTNNHIPNEPIQNLSNQNLEYPENTKCLLNAFDYYGYRTPDSRRPFAWNPPNSYNEKQLFQGINQNQQSNQQQMGRRNGSLQRMIRKNDRRSLRN